VFAVPLAVNVGVNAGTGLLAPSRSVMVTVEVATPSAVTVLVPVMFEFAATGAPGSKRTVPSDLETGVRIESVFVSAVVEARVQVETPVTSVAEQAATVLFVPVAPKVGVRPSTGLLFASFNVTVTVEVATPSATTGPVPVMLEFAAIGVPAVKTTTPSAFVIGAVIERVLLSALVDTSVQVATPFASVIEHTDGVLLVPLALNVGVTLLTGLLKASCNVIVTSEVAIPSATTGLVPVMVDVATATAPATKVTEPSALMTGVSMVRIFVSALVEVNVQVAIPLELVTEQLPYEFALPSALKVGVWPATGLLAASRKVMVTVEVATPLATTELVPVMFELAAIGAPAVKVTVPSDLFTGEVIVRVLTSAVSDESVQFETPVAFVALQAPFVLLPPVSVAKKSGFTPETGLLNASSKVMVMNEVATPLAATGLVPVMVELAAATGPATKRTVPSDFVTGVTIARVLLSAFVEERVHVEAPLALPTEHAESELFVPLALNVGVNPGAGLPPASLKVTVTVLVATPSAIMLLVPLIDDVAATGGPGSNTTVPPTLTTGVAMDKVFVSATVERTVHVATPLAFVALQVAWVLPVPLVVKVGTMPATRLLKASARVIVTVERATLSAMTGPVPLMVEFAATAAPAVKTTLPPAFAMGVTIASPFVSAFVEASVQVALPLALVTPQDPKVLLVPELLKVGVSPATGLLKTSAT